MRWAFFAKCICRVTLRYPITMVQTRLIAFLQNCWINTARHKIMQTYCFHSIAALRKKPSAYSTKECAVSF